MPDPIGAKPSADFMHQRLVRPEALDLFLAVAANYQIAQLGLPILVMVGQKAGRPFFQHWT